MTAGASFGAYHAVNFGLRHPWLVSRIIGMSGLYDIRQMTDGYSDPLVYAHDPSHFMLHLPDPGHIEALRRVDIILAIGRDDPSYQSNEHMSHVLWQRGIGNALRIWDGWVHDWPWWQQMIVRYVGGHD
jgi:esterase/lipase superfamily enzyme